MEAGLLFVSINPC